MGYEYFFIEPYKNMKFVHGILLVILQSKDHWMKKFNNG